MLKVLYLPLNDADSVQQATYDAFNDVGVKLEICDFYRVWLRTKNKDAVAADFLEKVRSFQPHLIHMQLQFTGLINASTLNEARKLCQNVIITNWSGDIRESAIPDFVSVAGAIDHSLISSTGQLQKYQDAGCKNVKYWQIGYDPKIIYPLHNETFKYDISFTANNYGSTFPDGPLRLSAAKALQTAFGARFGLFGSGYDANTHPLPPRRLNEVYNDSLCVLSISNFNNVAHYFSDRLLYCVGSGRPTISWYFPGCESYFLNEKEVFFVRSNEEIIKIVNFCKQNPKFAKIVGENGRKRVMKEHTFVSRIIELLHLTNLIRLV